MTSIDNEPSAEVKSYMDLGLCPSEGDEVITLDLESTEGMIVPGRLIESRKANMPGVIIGYVPGHGGDVWYVDHFAEAQAVYSTSELAPKQ